MIVIDFLRININKILGILLAGFLLISQFIFSTDWSANYPQYAKITIILGFIIYLITQIIEIKDNIDKSLLKKELDNWKKESSFLLEEYIKKIAAKLNFHDDLHDYDSRISLYKKDKKGFFCVSRFSDSEEYKKKSNDLYKYKGIVSSCWDKGNRNDKGYIDNDSPCPKNDDKGYKLYHQSKYGLKMKELKGLHMRARLYFSRRINNNQGEPIGVLLYESTNQNKFSENELNEIFTNIGDFEHIAKFTLPNLPSPHYDKFKKL